MTEEVLQVGVALGAASGDVLKMVLFEGFRMALAGLIAGLTGAFAVTRFLSTMLFKVQPTDAITYSGAVVLVALVTLLASYFPARRAAQVDPSVALRQE